MDITKYTQEWVVNAWLKLPLPYKMVYWAYLAGETSKGQASKACNELDELYSNLDRVKELEQREKSYLEELDVYYKKDQIDYEDYTND